MTFTLLDFLIGFFLMNAMPHMIFGIIRLRFLSLFGYSAMGNLIYAFLSVGLAGYIYHYQYHITSISHDGFLLGALAVLFMYLVAGRFLVSLFQPKHKPDLSSLMPDK